MFIKLDDIIPNRFQPREVFEEEALNKLADSIRKHGVIEPIIVRPVSNKYEIVAGERRYKASVLAGLTKIPAIVKQMDDKESSIVAYIENEHRSDVSAIEEARTIDRILKNNGMTQEELAGELGIGQSTLANKLRLLSLPMEIQNALMHNEISERHARSLLSVKDEAKQIELLNRIKENKMTVRELDSEIKNMNNDMNNNFNLYENNNFNQPISEPSIANFNSNLNNNIDNNTMPNDGFTSFLNNYDNIVQTNIPAQNESNGMEPLENNILNDSQVDNGFMDYLNNYDNSNPVDNTVNTPVDNGSPIEEDQGFMNFLNNYDNSNTVNNVPNTLAVDNQPIEEDQNFMSFLNSYDNNNPLPENEPENLNSIDNSFNEASILNDNNYLNNDYDMPSDNNVVINNVTPPITSGFDNNSYVESNPNFVDVSQSVVISSVDEIINKLKTVVDDIKANSKFKVDTDEINFDDIYQITIKIDKRDF